MGKIKILDEKTASKIAAGEVVERPASVVKELLENSIDAKATEIEIKIENGGKTKIIVKDNGEGMDKEDLLLCYKPHATSKLSCLDDFKKLKTLGFRGEALHSIAAVSRLIIRSKTTSSSTGYQITVVGGKFKKIIPVGMNAGTEIIVENLFFNMPARKKFLKSEQTELKHVLREFQKIALTNPSIKFKLFHNNRLLSNLKSTHIEKRIEEVLKINLRNQFIHIKGQLESISITGYISKPQFTNSLPQIQYVFVNNRAVRTPIAKKSIALALHTLLPEKIDPRFIVFLEAPPYMFDINIHPRKEEIKFQKPNAVISLIQNAVKNSITDTKVVFKPTAKTQNKNNTYVFTLKEPTSSYSTDKFSEVKTALFTNELLTEIKHKKYLQALNLFIIFETKNGIIIADQHAANERVIFEKLLKKYKSKDSAISQQLLIPIIIETSLALAQSINELLPLLNKIGFKLEPFGESTFRLTHIPSIINEKQKNPKEILINAIEDFKLTKNKLPSSIENLIATIACRSAVKSGDQLSEEEINEIIQTLEKSETKYTCPHGRPTHILITKQELEKLFKRRN